MPIDDALADIGAALAGPQQGGAPAIGMAQPQSGVDAALADLAKPVEQLHAEIAAARPQSSGPVANLAAGANDTAASIIGAPVDAMTWGLNKARGLVTGNDQPWITHPVGSSDSIRTAMGWIGADPRNVVTGSTPDQVARGAGAGMVGMAAPYMAGRSMIAHGVNSGLAGALARVLGGSAPADAGALSTAAGAAANAAIGAGASLGGQGASALLPENSQFRPLTDFGGQMVGGGLVAGGMSAAKAGINYGSSLARETLGPMRRDTLENIVGNKLYGASDDPAALAATLDAPRANLVPGSMPTTFQATGDQGIGRLQSTLPGAPFEARAAEQNAARVGSLQTIAPGGNAGAVREFLQQHLDSLSAEGDANVAAARQNVAQALEQAGGRLNAEDYGALMRDQLEAAKSATKQSESALWQAIDHDGKLTIDGQPVREAASQILSDLPKTAKPPEGEEHAVFGFARLLGSAAPFQDFAALRGRLLQAIRDERQNGQTPALRRMQMLRQSMDDTISATAARAAQSDPALLGRLGQQAGDYYGPTNPTASAATAGGYSGGAAAINPSQGPSAASGLSGAAGQAGGGFGSAPGYPRISEPPRPQDLVQFLRAQGGLQDQGGELRALDLHKLQGFGRVVRPDGMPLDTARETAVESGYLHPDSDVNDLLAALRRNQSGAPVFSESDPAAVAWREHDRARQRGEFEPMPPLPGDPATFDAAAAGRYRQAADATRNRAQTFNNPAVGPALQERNGGYRIADSRLPERFIASPEGVQAFLNAGGDRGTLRDALVGDLRRMAANPDGTLSTTKFASWQLRRGAALRAFPELQQTLGDLGKAQQAVDAVSSASRQQALDFQRSAARHFINAEPEQAVSSALNGRNLVADFKALSGMVAGDPDAKAGLQRAVAEFLIARSVKPPVGDAEVGTISSAAFNRLLSRDLALGQVFSPDQMTALRNIGADLQRGSGSLPSGTTSAAKGSVLSQYLGHGVAALGGYLLGGVHGALEGVGGFGVAKSAVDALKRAGIERTEQLLTEALLNPDLAKTLLMKATPGNRPIIAQRLASQLRTLAAVGGLSTAGSSSQKPISLKWGLSTRPFAVPASPPPQWRSLVPGGALQPAINR